jgi:serine/threonine protein kinase
LFSSVDLLIHVSSGKLQAEPGSLDSRHYAVLKFCKCGYVNKEAAQHELEINKRLSSGSPSIEVIPYIQLMNESFEVVGPNGTHFCLVFDPMRETLTLFQSRLKRKRLPVEVMKMYLVCLLKALDYIHTECRIVHTGRLKVAFHQSDHRINLAFSQILS